MKFNTKTAVHVLTEFDRQNLIPFFEAIKPDCNKEKWTLEDIAIGDYALLLEHTGLWVCIGRIFKEYESIGHTDDYTILEGIPTDWRERMKTEAKLELATDILTDTLSLRHKDLDKIKTLETRIKELEDCLKKLAKWDEKYPKSKIYSYSQAKIVDNELSEIITQAKQLLNQ